MRNRVRIAVVAGAVLVVASFLIAVLPQPEPRYNGLTMGEWLKRMDYSQADEALLVLGTNNLPLLLKRLAYDHDKDPLYRALNAIPERFQSKRIRHFLWTRSDWVKESEDVFARIGTNAIPAIPGLEAIVDRGGWGAHCALGVLAELGQNGLAVVIGKAANTNAVVRFYAILSLGWHTDSYAARVVLTNALNDTDARIRENAWFFVTNR